MTKDWSMAPLGGKIKIGSISNTGTIANKTNITHQAEMLGKQQGYNIMTSEMMLCLLTMLHVNSQLADAESKCLLSGRIKDTPMTRDNIILSCPCWTMNCFYPIAPIIWINDGLKIFNHMNGAYFGCTNLTGQFEWNNTDFSIIKYSVESSEWQGGYLMYCLPKLV